MLLMYGPQSSTIIAEGKCNIYNLMSLSERYPQLNIIPPTNMGMYAHDQFDQLYYDFIIQNDPIFCAFMTIIMDLYYGVNVFLVVSEDLYAQMLVESLMKIIRVRYGIEGVKILTMDDLIYANDTDFNKQWGLYNLDMDKERYTYNLVKADMQSRGDMNGI